MCWLDVIVQCSTSFVFVMIGLWAFVNFLRDLRDYRRDGR